MADILTSLHGRKLGLTSAGALAGGNSAVHITNPCVGASIAVSAEGATQANQRDISIQLKDANGADITERAQVLACVMADASGDAFVTTGGSTGIAIGTDGALLALVAKKAFILVSEADGDIDLTWVDTGTEAAYLHLILPNGRRVVSAALTNA